jgi:hypothetical protein
MCAFNLSPRSWFIRIRESKRQFIRHHAKSKTMEALGDLSLYVLAVRLASDALPDVDGFPAFISPAKIEDEATRWLQDTVSGSPETAEPRNVIGL